MFDAATVVDGRTVLAGQTEGTWGNLNYGGSDFAAVALTEGTFSKTPSASPSHARTANPASGILLVTRNPTESTSVSDGILLETYEPTVSNSVSDGVLLETHEPTVSNSVGDATSSPQPSPAPTPAPTTSTQGGSSSNTIPIIAGAAAAGAGVALIAAGVCLWRKRALKQAMKRSSSPPPSYEDLEQEAGGTIEPSSLAVTASTVDSAAMVNAEFPAFTRRDDPAHAGGALPAYRSPPKASNARESLGMMGRRALSEGFGVGRVVIEAAQELAQHSQIPGVAEAATLVSILVTLVIDHQDSVPGPDGRIRRCRSIVMMLQRAANVLGEVRRYFKKQNLGVCLPVQKVVAVRNCNRCSFSRFLEFTDKRHFTILKCLFYQSSLVGHDTTLRTRLCKTFERFQRQSTHRIQNSWSPTPRLML